MTRLFRSLLLCISLFAFAGAQAQTDTATADALLRKSGLWDRLSLVETQVQLGFELVLFMMSGGPSSGSADKERIMRAVSSAYSPQRLRATALRAIAGGAGPAHIPELLRWYESPAGKAATSLEKAAGQADPQALGKEGAALLKKMPAARRALLESLVAETRAAEVMTEISLSTSQGVGILVGGWGPGGNLNSGLGAHRAELVKSFADDLLSMFAKTYSALPDDQLAQYVAFAKSDAGRRFHGLMLHAFKLSLADGEAELARAMAALKRGAKG